MCYRCSSVPNGRIHMNKSQIAFALKIRSLFFSNADWNSIRKNIRKNLPITEQSLATFSFRKVFEKRIRCICMIWKKNIFQRKRTDSFDSWLMFFLKFIFSHNSNIEQMEISFFLWESYYDRNHPKLISYWIDVSYLCNPFFKS